MKLLVISGSMGTGKTTVLAEASDILAARRFPHAAIDLDGLGIAYLSFPENDCDLMYRNLASVWRNYAAAGLTALLVARAMEDRPELERLRKAVPGADIAICRLAASIVTMQRRIRTREPGMHQQRFVDRAAELEMTLNRVCLEHFSVDNDDRCVTDVALEVLVRAGWLQRDH